MQHGYSFVIVGGAERSGTTSLFQYLADSHDFRMSRTKETDYFRFAQSPSLFGYLNEFPATGPRNLVEASPGYLADSEVVVPRMEAVLYNQSVSLVFILRSPLDRIVSNYRFLISRGHIEHSLSLVQLVTEALELQHSGLAYENYPWAHRTLPNGLYWQRLQPFVNSQLLPNPLVFDFDTFTREPRRILDTVYGDQRLPAGLAAQAPNPIVRNASISVKSRLLQRASIYINDQLEVVWLRYPRLKHRVKVLYRSLNGIDSGTTVLPPSLLDALGNYYTADIARLCRDGYVSDLVAGAWLEQFDGAPV